MINPNLEGNSLVTNNDELAGLFPPSLEENPLSLEIEPTKNGLYLDPFSQEEELLASEEAIKKKSNWVRANFISVESVFCRSCSTAEWRGNKE